MRRETEFQCHRGVLLTTNTSLGGRHTPMLTFALPQAVRNLCSSPWVHTCTLFDINTLNDIQCISVSCQVGATLVMLEADACR
ncbi:mCG1027309 [Mus musculus]|nr:mCG1027309 [Mus musculus]